VVAGSNPVIPTKQKSDLQKQITFFVPKSDLNEVWVSIGNKKMGTRGVHFSIFSEGSLGFCKSCHPDEPPFGGYQYPANLLICRVFHFSCIHMISFKTTFLVCNSVCKAVRILL
jgi:hypothetical protein